LIFLARLIEVDPGLPVDVDAADQLARVDLAPHGGREAVAERPLGVVKRENGEIVGGGERLLHHTHHGERVVDEVGACDLWRDRQVEAVADLLAQLLGDVRAKRDLAVLDVVDAAGLGPSA